MSRADRKITSTDARLSSFPDPGNKDDDATAVSAAVVVVIAKLHPALAFRATSGRVALRYENDMSLGLLDVAYAAKQLL